MSQVLQTPESGASIVPTESRNWLYRLDSAIRRFDRWFNAIEGNQLEKYLPILRGHSLSGMAAFLALIPFLVLGPSFSSFRVWQPSAYVTVVMVYAAFFFIAWLAHRRLSLFCTQCATLMAMFGFLFVLPILNTRGQSTSFEWTSSEISGGLYPHLLLPFAMIMGLVAMVAGLGARYATAKIRDEFPEGQKPEDLLRITELFENPDKEPTVSQLRMLLALIMVPLKFPVEWLLLPSIYVVAFANGGAKDTWFMLGLLALGWLLIAFGEVHERIRLARRLLQRLFSYGGLWLTSVVIIGLAGSWLAEVGYVRTVMEGDPWLVVQYLMASFCLFWWMEYWLNRALSQRLLGLFTPAVQTPSQVSFALADNVAITTKTKRDERYLQLHGAGRFIVLGKHADTGAECWNFIDRTDLFVLLAESAIPELREQVRKATKSIYARIKTYFVLLNSGLIAVLLGCMWYVETRDVQAVVDAKETVNTDQETPESLLFRGLVAEAPKSQTVCVTPASPTETPKAESPKRIILVAASGGGTRAALYATSMLHGLSRIDALDDVRLISGVSGGGLSLTWFASRYERLLAKDEAARTRAWEEYFEAMEYPYIVDVLHGGSEARIAQGVPLSQLLADSFGKRLYSEDEDIQWWMRDVSSRLGIILNTTLCGEFPPQKGDFAKSGSIERFDVNKSSGYHAGGRLIFTNINCKDAFSQIHPNVNPFDDKRLSYIVINDPKVRLASAAALNANFPPVFPNAAVDVRQSNGDIHRYWVTDGGAQENRGVISLLHVLKHAISKLPKTNTQKIVLPEIHIVVAEASADSVRYGADRGVGAVTVAKDHLAIAWANSLFAEVNKEYAALQSTSGEKAEIKMHIMPMPSCLRCGGIGTHWMLPKTVRIRQTDVPAADNEQVVELSQSTVMKLIRELHLPDSVSAHSTYPEADDQIQTVQSWIRNDPLFDHTTKWKNLQNELKRDKNKTVGKK